MWSKAREVANCTHLRLHDLRHTGLTWAADSGANTANRMQRGGHADPRGALRYQHATSEQDRAIADALATRATAPVLFLVLRDERPMEAFTRPEENAENPSDGSVVTYNAVLKSAHRAIAGTTPIADVSDGHPSYSSTKAVEGNVLRFRLLSHVK